MTRLRFLLVAGLTGVMGATACSNNSTPTTPTAPAPTTFTEVFAGTITLNGASSHSFIAQASGTVTVTLTALAPDAAQPIGVALGTWTGSACQVIIANDRAVQGISINGAIGSAGSLCTRVYDSTGTLAASTSVSYELSVVHP